MAMWWKDAVGYAIFPLSFQDSNGDGMGDIQGIINRLDYLRWLGVELVWLGPLYRSPMVDAGYDIADFGSIDPVFGTLEDFDCLVEQMHRFGMRLVMDFVPNHTSDQHPWFIESRQSRNSAKRDWYIWHDGKPEGGPPNNWIDNTKQTAWTWDPSTQQWYYHLFLNSQPDLNLRNRSVVEAIETGMRFWLDRGVDGFRLDSAMNLFEDVLLRDEPLGDELESGPPGWMDHVFTSDRPETHSLIARFRRLLDQYDSRVFIGEVQAPLARQMHYFGINEPMLHMPFNTQIMKTEPWEARRIDAAIEQYLQLLPNKAWPNWVLGSHDVPRLASRLGQAQARVASLIMMTLPGTPFIYYGDELGLERSKFDPDDAKDPYERFGLGRDAERGPMPWDNGLNSGFTTRHPWLAIADNRSVANVESQMADPLSMLHLHRRLIALRTEHVGLREGGFEPAWGNDDFLAYYRANGSDRFYVAANLSRIPVSVSLNDRGTVLVSTAMVRRGRVEGNIDLEPDEAVLVKIGG